MPGPSKIGKYDILREIGRGGMGKVYGAIDPTIGRMVAIKQVTAVVSDDPELLKRFYREAQSTGKLQHPNIVTLHDLGEQDGIPYLVMEYLEGDSLERIIHERRPYTVAEKLHIIIQVCEGLAYAHERQIIHRDIKPGNIVVLNEGGVKIVDFGIAQFGTERFTRTGQVVGSLYYMSPEQLQDADIDVRSDIYSTGIVLFEFLSGSLPFRGKDPASTMAKILHDTPASLADSVDVHATELDSIVAHALAKDPNKRYTSMEDFAFDLRTLEEKLSHDLIANYRAAAENFMTAREWDKAREQLRQILKLDKQNRRANELLRDVQVEIQRQRVTEQVRQFRQRADEALGLRKWDEALALLDQAIKIDGSDAELIRFRESVQRSSTLLTDALRRAESAHNAGDLDAAKQAVEQALSVDPYNTTAKALNTILTKQIKERARRKKIDDLMADARKETALRRFSSALEMLRAAEAIDSSVIEVQQLIRSATAGLEHERRRVALEQACAEIEDLLNRDEYVAACNKADEALLRFPQDLGLIKLKGFAERQREAWDRQRFLEAQVASARQLVDSGDFLRAQRILNEAVERYPGDSGAISLLGIVTDAIAHQEAQRREAERQASEKRHYIQAQIDAAAELQQNGQPAEALKKIRDGLARYADSEELKQRASVLESVLAKEETERKRAEEEASRKKAEVERTIAESWQLLSSNQTGQAVAMLDEAVRRHPDSADLKSQLEFAQRRLAVAKAERERAEQEARRKAADIQKELAAAQQLMDSHQVDQAVAALEKTVGHYPDSDELKSVLQMAYRRQSAERAARELAEREARQRRAEIESEILAARGLLDAQRTSESVIRLQRVIERYPESEELKQLLTYAQQRLAAEALARKKAEDEERHRRAWIDAEITVTRQWVSDKQADRAVTRLEQALHQYPENEQLKAELDFARRRAAQEQAEKEKKEQEARRRREEISQAIHNAMKLLDSGKTSEAVASLERAILHYPESQEIRTQLDLAKTRFAEEAAEKQRIAEETRCRLAEIERALLSARVFLESDQTSRAVTALEFALQRYPDCIDLRTQLAAARQRLASEEAERRRFEEEERRKQEEVQKELMSATRLLDAGQLARAIESLTGAIRRIPDSEELKLQIKRVQERIASEEAARQKAEQEKKRRQAEISNASVNARRLLESRQTSKAVSALELAARNYPESEELRALLAAAQAVLAQERAALEKAEREAQERRKKIAAEVENAKQLLRANQTAKALAALDAALGRYAESEELRAQLAAAKEQQARELAEKEKAEKRQAQLLAERAKIRTLLDSGEPDKAVEVTETALRTLGKEPQLLQMLDTAKAAVKAKKAQEKKRAAELHQAEEQRLKRERDLEELNALAASVSSTTKPPALEKLQRKAEAIAGRYPNDAVIQKSLGNVKSEIEHLLAEPQQPEAAETRLATKLFAAGQVAETPPVVSTPTPLPRLAAQESAPASFLPKLLNKWTVVAVLGLLGVGVGLKFLVSPKKAPVTTTVTRNDTQPGEDEQRQAVDQADKLVASGDLEGALKVLQRAGTLSGPLTAEIHEKQATIEAAKNDAGLRKLRQEEESLWQAAKVDLDAGRFQGAQASLAKILALPSGGTRKEEARNYLDQVLPRRQQEDALFATSKQSAFSKDLPTLIAAQTSLDSVVRMNGPRKAEAEILRRTVASEIAEANNSQRERYLSGLQSAAQQDISRGDLASARQKADQIKAAGGSPDSLVSKIDHALADKAKSDQYENSYQTALQQYQQAAASNDKSGLERARDSFRTIAQQEGAHSRDAQKYLHDAESKIVALNQPPRYSASQPASPAGQPDLPFKNSPDEGALIRDVIRRYEQAFADRNADELRQVWPDIGDKYSSYKKSFGLASAQHLEVTIESVKISDNVDQATVTASTITDYTPRGAKTIRRPDRAQFELLKKNGSWLIKDVR